MAKLTSLAALSAVIFSTCGPATPTSAGRQVDSQLLEGLQLVATQWPDTMIVGQQAPAAVEVLLANGVPYPAPYINWVSSNVAIAGMYPTTSVKSKLVLALAPDTVSFRIDAYVPRKKNPNPTLISDYYHASLLLHLVVLSPSIASQ
jgi:hypothetical protein